MKRSILTAFVVCSLVLCAAMADEAIDAKDGDFEEIIARHELSLVKFYAPWCGHCKRLAPEWDKAATMVAGKAGLIRVDCTTETVLAEKFEIRGYPTIKVFRDGQIVGDYEGGRTADAIASYIQSNIGPSVTLVTGVDEIDNLKKEHPIVVVAYTADEGTTAAVTHAAAAKNLRSNYKFARGSVELGTPESIVVFKQFDEDRVVYEGDVASVPELTKFLRSTSIKLFDEMGPDNYKLYMDRGIPLGWLFVNPTSENAASVKSAVAEAAPQFQGEISLVWIDAEKYGGMSERLGVRKGHLPAFVVDRQGEHFVFPEENEISKESIAKFIGEVNQNSVKPTVRSTAAPEVHTVEGLTTVVGSTFDDLVVNSGKDVLIEFYAPWCGHCKKLQPTFERVAKELSNVEGIRIAQIDAGENDFNTKLFKVAGFPTIYYVPANGSPKLYEGSRSVMGFLNFLKEESAVPFELPTEEL